MRRRLPRAPAGLAVAVVAVGLLAGSAMGYFSGAGAGEASAGVTNLATPAITEATPQLGGTVALAWTAVSGPGPSAVRYTVLRDGEPAGGNCPDNASAPMSCTDSGVAAGEHGYVVIARWRTWTATSADSETTVPAEPPARLALSVDDASPTAGAAANLTITAMDSYGNIATTYSGPHSITFSGAEASPAGSAPTVTDSSGSAVAFGAATTLDFSAGVASVSGGGNGVMRLYKSGAASVSAGDGSISTASPLAVTVSVDSAAGLTLGAASTAPPAGAGNNLTISAVDSYGNVATTYAGPHSITFSGAEASPAGSAPTVTDSSGYAVAFGGATTLDFSAGVASVSGGGNGVMRLYKSGAASISAGDGSISTASPLAVTVAAGPPSNLSFVDLTSGAGTVESPCLFTCAVSDLGNEGTIEANVAVTDGEGNPVSDLGPGHTVSVSSSGGKVSGGTLAIPPTGAAVSTTRFAYTSKAKGNFKDTVTAATSAGTAYTSATLATSRK